MPRPSKLDLTVASGASHQAATGLKTLIMGCPTASDICLPCRFSTSSFGRPPKQFDLRLYGVTDPGCNDQWGRSNAEAVGQAIAGGMTLVQLREKLADGGHFLAEAKAVIQVAHQHGVSCPWPGLP